MEEMRFSYRMRIEKEGNDDDETIERKKGN